MPILSARRRCARMVVVRCSSLTPFGPCQSLSARRRVRANGCGALFIAYSVRAMPIPVRAPSLRANGCGCSSVPILSALLEWLWCVVHRLLRSGHANPCPRAVVAPCVSRNGANGGGSSRSAAHMDRPLLGGAIKPPQRLASTATTPRTAVVNRSTQAMKQLIQPCKHVPQLVVRRHPMREREKAAQKSQLALAIERNLDPASAPPSTAHRHSNMSGNGYSTFACWRGRRAPRNCLRIQYGHCHHRSSDCPSQSYTVPNPYRTVPPVEWRPVAAVAMMAGWRF